MIIGNQKMFVSPFSFTGRIGRLEYVLSAILILALYFGLLFGLKYLDAKSFEYFRNNGEDDVIWSHLYNIVFFLHPYAYILLFWFGWAQGVKRCHDLGHSGWCMLIPLYGLIMLFVKGNEGDNEYGSAPGSDVAVDSVDKSGTMRNSYVRFYLCCMMVMSSGVLANIFNNIRHGWTDSTDIFFWIYNVMWIIVFLGFVLLFHYRKVAFYVVSVIEFFYFVRIIYIMVVNSSFDILSFLWLALFASVFFLYPMLKKASEWENLENSFQNLSWKSVLLYMYVLEAGWFCYFLLV